MWPEARRIWPSEKRRVEKRRKTSLDIVQLRSLPFSVVGARRSESVPVRRRAMVEVRAIIETCVAGELESGGPEVEGG